MTAKIVTNEERAGRLSAARTALVLDHPFFGALALRLKITEAPPSITKTMATDGRSLFYSPAFVDQCSDDELLGLFAHEVSHPAMQHHTRMGPRDLKRWNRAADYAVNPLLVDAGFTLPEGGLLDDQFRGLSAEQIYERLPHDEGDDGDGNEQGQGSGSDDPSDGSGDQPGPVADVPGAVLPAPDMVQDAADWQVAVTQAANAAKMMGRLPGGMQRAVAEMTRAKADWRAILRRFVQQTAACDYSWKAPNRRYMQHGIYLPELRSESMPPFVIGNDTSGSISDAIQGAFTGEMNAIAEECQPESITVIHADADVAGVETFEKGDPIVLHPAGGGGTDFRPLFEHVEREGLQPACIIYLTDGYGTFPESSEIPTLWVMTTDVVAPFGETVRIEL